MRKNFAAHQRSSSASNAPTIEPDFSYINSDTSAPAQVQLGRMELDALCLGARILVVEDNEEVLRLIEHALNRAGFAVATSTNGEQALQIFRSAAYDIPLVILDECIPHISGHELSKLMHSCRPGTRVILTSGYFGDDYDPPAIDSAYAIFLHKPYSIEKLLQVVRGSLDSCGNNAVSN